MNKFVHLHTHTHYSLLDGLSKPSEIIKFAKKEEMPAIAITDHGNMYGAIEFYQKAKKEGIKPIIGVEAYIANNTRFDKRPNLDNKRYHLTLLAKDKDGYNNIVKMVTLSNLEGYYYKPRMDKQLLRDCHKGVICLSGCLGGELSQALWNKDYEKAKLLALEYQDIFGKENYFIEIMHHPKLERFLEIRDELVKLSKELNIPLVGTQDSHYLRHDDNKAHDTLVAIQTNTDITDEDRMSNIVEDFSFVSTEEANELFKENTSALESTVKIGEMVDLNLTFGNWVFPKIEITEGLTADEELRKLTFEGIKRRGLEPTTEITNRIEYELKIIKDKGYSPYFLVVADLLRFARSKDILTNIRGSVAGSIVTYLNFITNVDPLVFGLPFERFLNPERPSAPDIDMDYADNRRDEVIEYAKQKYGADKVAQIGTFGTMMARGSVRDVARALAFPYEVGDRLSKLIPMGAQGFPMTIKKAMVEVPELKKIYDEEKDAKEILDLAMKIEGTVRHCSVHAAGVVIAPTPLIEWTPLQLEPRGNKVITQYDMHVVEDMGLLKFDFLGIRNLAILGDAVRLVKEHLGIFVDIDNMPMDDKKTFEMLAKGETMGLFQLNGDGMTKYLKELRPSTIHDINAMVALYRPGPIESIPMYIERKHNPKLVKFMDKRLETILDKSFGVITYQDDVMLIAIKLAGYSWLEADKLRKAMGKKIPEEMAAQKEKLLTGFVKNGLSEAKSQELWTLIEPFAAYGFNKAHAASYGRVAYQTAYMKANYPAEYMAAVLTAESDDIEKIGEIINECNRMGTPVLPPNVNESFISFTVIKKDGTGKNKDMIRFGLNAIKNLGTEIGNFIIEERKNNGPFKTYGDFLSRVKHRNLNKKSLEALVKGGAMDSFGERGMLLQNMDNALSYNKELSKDNGAQASLFGLLTDKSSAPDFKLKDFPPATLKERLDWEKELLGLYLSGHPLQAFEEKFKKQENTIQYIKKLGNGKPVVVAGIINEIKNITTKKNEQMAFVKISDFSDSMEIVVFPKTLAQFKDILLPDKIVAIKGALSLRNDSVSVIADAVKELSK
ncbi:MAG: DNA polymerase III subunit alpha [bacterium]